MTQVTRDRQMQAYSEAVKTGLYAKSSGLVGKYDNVRRFWEDEVTRQGLYPHLRALVERVRAAGRGLRIIDLGCGSADGYELLAGIRKHDATLHQQDVALLRDGVIAAYKGVDLNADLLDQARGLYGSNETMRFEQADFTRGLPLSSGEPACDLYFMSYGATSHHNDDETLVSLLAEIADRTERRCLVVCDWLGRYSYEWQSLWTRDVSDRRNMDYVVSYIYDKQEREAKRDELQHLTLRLMSRGEAEAIVAEAGRRAHASITPLSFFDRSALTGRHMDTSDYNRHARPIRQAVNSLLEPHQRTPLDSVLFEYAPKPGFDEQNGYFEQLGACWNTLIEYVGHLLCLYDEHAKTYRSEPPPVPDTCEPALARAMARMQAVVARAGMLDASLARENLIEPQLAGALRALVASLQCGQGCAHGLVGVLEISKE
jgi:SAM-dependent methyltransferase